MEAFLYYLLKVNLIITVLVLMFHVFFRKEKFLQLNRFLLLGIAIVSFVLPILPDLAYEVAVKVKEIDLQRVLPVTENAISPSSVIKSPQRSYQATGACVIMYLVISTAFLLRLFLHIARTIKIIRDADKIKEDGLIFCAVPDRGPFSFFNYIVIPAGDNTEIDQQVLLHERAHAKQVHSADALFSEMVAAILWINPFIYLYKKLVRANLEFLADDSVLKKGADRKIYQLSLLRHVMGRRPAVAVNAFRSSGIRTRIGMMNTAVPSGSKAGRYIFMMPVICLIYISVNQPKAMAGVLLPDLSVISSAKKINRMRPEEMHQGLQPIIENKRTIIAFPVQKNEHTTATESMEEVIKYNVNIEARTDTVRINLVPATGTVGKKFEGIYIIGDEEYSDDEIRDLAANGTYEILLPAKPALAYYQPNHQQAILQWGDKAAKGVILVRPPSFLTP